MPNIVLSPSSRFPTAPNAAPSLGFDAAVGFDANVAFGADPPFPAIDIEWAPASAPGDAPSWRSLVGTQDGVRSLSITSGRPLEYQRFAPATCQAVVENWTGALDPDWSGSPVAGMVLPNRQFRVIAKLAGTEYPLFQGYLDGFPEPFGFPTPEPVYTLTATDALKLLARAALPKSMLELAITKDAPDHWWRLNETVGLTANDNGTARTFGVITGASDQAPGTYIGTVPGASAIIPFDGGNSCVAFDHTSLNRVDIPFRTIAAYPFSIEAWIMCSSGPAYRSIFWKGSAGFGANVGLFVDSGASFGPQDTLGFRVDAGTVSRQVNSVAVVADGLVHHVAVTVTNATTYQLYIDGHAAAQTTTSTTGGGSPGVFGPVTAIGGFPLPTTGGAFGLDGSASNVAVYALVLTATQVLNHYNAGTNAFSGEDTGARVNRVLDAVGFPSSSRSIQPGSSTVGAYDLPGGKALDYIQTLADTEQNQWYCDGLGTLTWRSRDDGITATRSTTSQATFSDAAGAALQYARLQLDKSELNVINDVTATRQGGADQRAVDTDSVRKYFDQSNISLSGMWANDNVAADAANWVLKHHADPPTRITGIDLEPLDDMALMTQALSRKIGDRVTVVRTVQGSQLSFDFIIEGIRHTIDPTAVWVTSFQLSSADTVGPWFILNDATLGQLSTTNQLAF